jgi:hypothetical protein
LVETISHLKFNVALARALVKRRKPFTSKAIIMVGFRVRITHFGLRITHTK